MNTFRKLLSYFIVLGLALSSFCVYLIPTGMDMGVPAAMAASGMNMKADTMVGMQNVNVQNLHQVVNCGNSMSTNFNCCVNPINHNNEKSFAINPSVQTRHPLCAQVIKVELLDAQKVRGGNHPGSIFFEDNFSSSTALTGQIVKRE